VARPSPTIICSSIQANASLRAAQLGPARPDLNYPGRTRLDHLPLIPHLPLVNCPGRWRRYITSIFPDRRRRIFLSKRCRSSLPKHRRSSFPKRHRACIFVVRWSSSWPQQRVAYRHSSSSSAASTSVFLAGRRTYFLPNQGIFCCCISYITRVVCMPVRQFSSPEAIVLASYDAAMLLYACI
jgi:hypothetical protein